VRRSKRFRRNPDDYSDLLALGEEQLQKDAEYEQQLLSSYGGGLSQQALNLIREDLGDLNRARARYYALGLELEKKLSRQQRRDRIAARRALEQTFGFNALRDGQPRREEREPLERQYLPSREELPTGLPLISARRYTVRSKPIYRGVQRRLADAQEYPGVEGMIQADRDFARALLQSKAKLENQRDKARTDEKRQEFEAKLQKLSELAESFIQSRREVWAEAQGFGVAMGMAAPPDKDVEPRVPAPERRPTERKRPEVKPTPAPPPQQPRLTVGQKVTPTTGYFKNKELEIVSIEDERVGFKTAEGRTGKIPIALFLRSLG